LKVDTRARQAPRLLLQAVRRGGGFFHRRHVLEPLGAHDLEDVVARLCHVVLAHVRQQLRELLVELFAIAADHIQAPLVFAAAADHRVQPVRDRADLGARLLEAFHLNADVGRLLEQEHVARCAHLQVHPFLDVADQLDLDVAVIGRGLQRGIDALQRIDRQHRHET